MRWLPLLVLLVPALGCGSEDRPRPPARERAQPMVAAPDAGMPAGHANEPRRVRVPERDRTAPQAVLRLGATEALSGARAPAPVRLDEPVVRSTAVGRDKQGMTRIRVSVQARITCGSRSLPLVRYVPPPEIARPRIPPGRMAPIELVRTVRLDLAAGRCPASQVRAVEGTLRADATSAWETEASSPPLRFTYDRG